MTLGLDRIREMFGYHKPLIGGDQDNMNKHIVARRQFRDFARFLDETLPDGREKSLVFTKLEETSMWTHKAIASLAPVVDEELPQDRTEGTSGDENLTFLDGLKKSGMSVGEDMELADRRIDIQKMNELGNEILAKKTTDKMLDQMREEVQKTDKNLQRERAMQESTNVIPENWPRHDVDTGNEAEKGVTTE